MQYYQKIFLIQLCLGIWEQGYLHVCTTFIYKLISVQKRNWKQSTIYIAIWLLYSGTNNRIKIQIITIDVLVLLECIIVQYHRVGFKRICTQTNFQPLLSLLLSTYMHPERTYQHELGEA